MERWIGKFELAIEIDEKEDKEAQVLCMFLDDAAYDVYNNLPPMHRQDATAIKAALRNAFGMRRIDAWKAALGKRVHVGEPLDVAGDEIKKYYSIICQGSNAADLIPGVLLLDSLPVNIREQVTFQVGNDLTYLNVLEAAKKIWPSRTESGACAGLRMEVKRSTTEDIHETKIPRRLPPPRCVSCKRIGHIRQNCRTICFKCNEIGHISKNCTAVPLNGVEGATLKSTVVPHPHPQAAQNNFWRPPPQHQQP